MLFGRDGSVRTTAGWHFHEERESATGTDVGSAAPVSSDKAAILDAIRATSERHAKNKALRHARLSADHWHILFRSLIEAESAYHPTAMSPKGAYGLGQLMPDTAHRLGVDRTDMAQNLDGAARYLLAQLSSFRDIDLALAAYNAGPHRVANYSGVPPFRETQAYIARIHRIRARLSNFPAQEALRVCARGPSRPGLVVELK